MGLFEDGDGGVGVFAGGEEILVGNSGVDGVFLQGIGPRDSEVGQGVEDAENVNAAMVEDFLIFEEGVGGVPGLQISGAPKMESQIIRTVGATTEIVRPGRFQRGDGFLRLVALKFDGRLNRGKTYFHEKSIGGESRGKLIVELLGARNVAQARQRHARDGFGITSGSEAEGLRNLRAGFSGIAHFDFVPCLDGA